MLETGGLVFSTSTLVERLTVIMLMHDLCESNPTPPIKQKLPPLAERLALSQAKHPGQFAEVIWEVEPHPARGLVSSLYARAGG